MIDHHEVSELLAPHLRGELDADRVRELSEHLASCEDCSAELRALQALTAPVDDDLTEIERARLERGVSEAVLGGWAANEEVFARPGGARRLTPWLGVAATVLLVAVGVATLDFSPSDHGESSSGSGTRQFATEDSDGVEAGPPVEVGGPDIAGDASVSSEALTESSGAGGSAAGTEDSGSDATAKSAAQLPARFDPDAGTFESRELRDYASTQDPFRSFSLSYSAPDAERLAPSYLTSLAGAAPDASGRQLLRACAEQVLQQDFPIMPAYGAHGRFEGRDVLVLGFVYAPKNAALDRYLVWVWPRESCDSPVKIIAGRIVQ